jgi:streptogramin lyase
VTRLGAGILLTALALAALGSSVGRGAEGCTVGTVPAGTGTFGIGGYGNLLAFGDGALWVGTDAGSATGEEAGRLRFARVEPRAGARPRQVLTLRARGDARYAVGRGELWVSDPRGTLTRVELRSGARRVLRPFAADEPSELALTRAHVWITSAGGRLAKVSRASARVVRRAKLADALGDVVAAGGTVWVSTAETGTVVGVDAATLRPRARIRTGGTALELVAGGGSLWVDLGTDEDTIARIDPKRRAVTGRFGNGGDAFALAAGLGSVWVTNYGRATVTRLDVETGRAETTRVGRDPKGIVLGAGSAWVMNAADCSVTRIVA